MKGKVTIYYDRVGHIRIEVGDSNILYTIKDIKDDFDKIEFTIENKSK